MGPRLVKRKHRVVVSAKPKKQTHNSSMQAKVDMRRWLVTELTQHLGRPPMILDCFCAEGALWTHAYDKTPHYLGLDIRQFNDERPTIVTDSRRFLRHVDASLERFDIFDLDAFGSPLEHLAILGERLRLPKGRRIGLLLTDGTGLNAKMNSTPTGLLHYVGIERHRGAKVQASERDVIFRMSVAKSIATAGLKVLEARRAEKGGGHSDMRYMALLLESERE